MKTRLTLPTLHTASLLFIALLATPCDLRAQSYYPVLQVEPTMNGGQPTPNPTPLREACLDPGSWPTGWTRLDLFGNAVQFFAALNDGDLAQCVANVRNAGKQLVVAGWSLKSHCQTAQACWDGLAPTFRRMRDLGARIDYFEIDEPLTAGVGDYNYAVDQTAEWIRLARSEFPGVKMILQEAYPAAQSASTLRAFYRDVHNTAIARTGSGIHYAQLDHDWNAPGWSFSDITSIQNSVRADGMSFSVIFWAAGNRPWYDGLMEQGRRYRDAGVRPDSYAVINWTGAPSNTVPEWAIAGGRSFTNSVRDFANTWLPTSTSTYGLRPNEWLNPGEYRFSVDGRFRLEYQWDGNLVLYLQGSGALWNSGTYGASAGRAIVQGDGNFVVYDAGGVARWESGTWGNPGAFMVVQSDGNMVIYRDVSPLWATNTNWY